MSNFKKNSNRVIWITGLSGAGKTTLANELVQYMKKNDIKVIHLDGDELREVFSISAMDSKDYERKSRLSVAMKYSKLCELISAQGFNVVISTISLFSEVHAWNRNNLPGYLEVYLKVPVDELCRRDPKGIYSQFYAGKITNIAGLDLCIDEPQSPDLVFEFRQGRQVNEMLEELINFIKDKDLK